MYCWANNIKLNIKFEKAVVAQGHKGVTVTRCGFDPHSKKLNIYLNLYLYFFALVPRQRATLSSVIQHAIPPKFGGKWGTECFNTRFPMPTLLCAGQREADLFDFLKFGLWRYSFYYSHTETVPWPYLIKRVSCEINYSTYIMFFNMNNCKIDIFLMLMHLNFITYNTFILFCKFLTYFI